MKTYREFKKTLLKDSEVKKAYKELEPEFSLVEMIIKKRLERGLTQKELAFRVGTRQSAIARLESGRYNPSIAFLNKVARALNGTLRVHVKLTTTSYLA